MSVELEKVVGYQFKPAQIRYTERDVSLYGLSNERLQTLQVCSSAGLDY